VPKAYRPIALISTTSKLLTSIIADQVSFNLEIHNLLLAHHFGGRPGRTTTDSFHTLEVIVKYAWRSGKVASILFLDIEGAFPNAVTDRLAHNMRKRRLPPDETALAFVDDTAYIAIGPTFEHAHAILKDMMERPKGALQWSRKHNSRFEVNKFALWILPAVKRENARHSSFKIRPSTQRIITAS
jgi:hypothetical protein